jgi:murein DD-endopeptidase MepM/ murein hydrolase activator NlpD
VTIVDHSGTRWTYCHGSRLTTTLGASVAAGQQILWSGDTGRSGAPHLHLEIRVDGIQRCPQPLLVSRSTNAVGIEPAALPSSGCSF